jgi:carbonic anhydrase
VERSRLVNALSTTLRSLCVLLVGALGFTGCGSDNTGERRTPPRSGPSGEDASFSYRGATGPERWGELDPKWRTCKEGSEQSPIDLAGAKVGKLPSLEPDYKRFSVAPLNNGRSVELKGERAGGLRVGGRMVGRLSQIHYHVPGEHVVGGARPPMELHLVHTDDEGAFTVLGLPVVRGEANPALEAWSKALPSEEGEKGAQIAFEPEQLLPGDLSSLRYSGSLTTPPCTESVRWIVLATPLEASAEQLRRFRARYDGNARPVQARGDRAILRTGERPGWSKDP